jgi:hypothetical protein
MNYVNQPVEAGNQTNDATSPALELGKVIDPHPVYAAMAKAREAADANGTEVADVLWDPASPELAVDDDDYWNDLTERNWETLSRWYAMALAASRKGETLHFKVRDGVETVTVINVAQPNIASEPTPDTLPAIISPVDGTGPQQAVSSVMTATTSPIATLQELANRRRERLKRESRTTASERAKSPGRFVAVKSRAVRRFWMRLIISQMTWIMMIGFGSALHFTRVPLATGSISGRTFPPNTQTATRN